MNKSHTSWLRVLSVLQAATLGLVVMLYFGPDESGPDSASNARPESTITWLQDDPSSHVSQVIETERLKSALREVLNEELETFNDGESASGAAIQVSHASPGGDDLHAGREAAAVSNAIVRQAISAGVWTAEDTETLMPHLGTLSEEQRLELIDRFYSAINRQELNVEDVPPL